jgi:hypothetical protein
VQKLQVGFLGRLEVEVFALVAHRAFGPFPAELVRTQEHPQSTGTQLHPPFACQPGGQLPGGPGLATHGCLVQQPAQRRQVFGPSAWGPARDGSVSQPREPLVQERLEILAHGLFVCAQCLGDLRHAPAQVGQAHHLQPLA